MTFVIGKTVPQSFSRHINPLEFEEGRTKVDECGEDKIRQNDYVPKNSPIFFAKLKFE